MSSLYETIQSLCDERGLKFTALAKKAGISPGILYDLKDGRKKTVTLPTAQKIANALSVDASILTGEQTEKTLALAPKDERDIAKKIDEIMGDLEHADGLMFDGVPMTEESIESMRAAMKLGLEAAKLKNKEKYTPKKYKGDKDGD